MPGPISSGYTPARDKYKCPVNNCKAENVRGYDITGHFRTNSDLKSLDEALENFSLLKKDLKAGVVIKHSDEYLKSLLIQESNNKKLHTVYLFQNGFSSTNLPDYNSINFKCQQKKELDRKRPISKVFDGFFKSKKKKSDEVSTGSVESSSTNLEHSSINLEHSTTNLEESSSNLEHNSTNLEHEILDSSVHEKVGKNVTSESVETAPKSPKESLEKTISEITVNDDLPKKQICDCCDENNFASAKCEECDDFLCNECVKAHKRVKITKNHTLSDYEMIGKDGLISEGVINLVPLS